MKLLVCDCGGHEFVVFSGAWLPTAKNGMASRLSGACVRCGGDWNLETVLWEWGEGEEKAEH